MPLTPVVSVIIPAYNAATYIKETLDTVVAQMFKDFEVIVINDGSPDTEALEHVVQSYSVVYIKQPNQGPSAARNAGISAAKGRIIAFLDADDLWEPECLQEQLKAISGFDMVYADARIFGGQDAGHTLMELSPSYGEVTFEKVLSRECVVNLCVTMVWRDTLLRAGLFHPGTRQAEDADLWLRILLTGGTIGYHRKVLGHYCRRAGSLSSENVNMIQGYLSVLKRLWDFPLTIPQRHALNAQILMEEERLRFETSPRTRVKNVLRALKESILAPSSRLAHKRWYSLPPESAE